MRLMGQLATYLVVAVRTGNPTGTARTALAGTARTGNPTKFLYYKKLHVKYKVLYIVYFTFS